jgi:hypothetical protein
MRRQASRLLGRAASAASRASQRLASNGLGLAGDRTVEWSFWMARLADGPAARSTSAPVRLRCRLARRNEVTKSWRWTGCRSTPYTRMSGSSSSRPTPCSFRGANDPHRAGWGATWCAPRFIGSTARPGSRVCSPHIERSRSEYWRKDAPAGMGPDRWLDSRAMRRVSFPLRSVRMAPRRASPLLRQRGSPTNCGRPAPICCRGLVSDHRRRSPPPEPPARGRPRPNPVARRRRPPKS